MSDSVFPLSGTARNFAERKFRGGVAWIVFQFLLKFLFCFVGILFRLAFGKRYPPQPEMNSRGIWILVENLLILRGGFCPATLRFERLGLQFLRLVRSGRFSRQFLRSAHRQL